MQEKNKKMDKNGQKRETNKTIALRLGVCEKTVRRAKKKGTLNSLKAKYQKSDLENLLERAEEAKKSISQSVLFAFESFCKEIEKASKSLNLSEIEDPFMRSQVLLKFFEFSLKSKKKSR